MSNPYNIKPGDALYAAWRWKENCAVRVGKVGSKWARLEHGNYRVNLETLDINDGNYSSPGRCYLSVEHYEQEQRRLAAWRELCNCVRSFERPPSHLTAEEIERVLGELRGEPR